nr:hypothetical protein [Amaricoccus solimangrovi]
MALLSHALDEARMAMENDAPEGGALITAVADVLVARDAARPFAPAARLRLAQVYARAGLLPPPFAVLTPETMASTEAAQEMPDLGALLEPILKEIGDAPLQVHAALGELFAGIPPELAAMLVSMTIARPGALEPRLGLYWLLDPRPEIRLAATTALLSRAEAGTLAPDLAALLPALRKWLPDDPARAALDAAIRRRMRDGGSRPEIAAEIPAVTIHRAAASLADGAGAQSLVAAIQRGGRRGVAMAMLKQGQAVKDAFVIPCASASEQRRMLARVLDEIETFDLPPAALAEALARGLGEGLALGLLPAPGLVDLAEIWGPEALAPAAGDTEAILAAIGGRDALEALPAARRAALVRESIDWMDCFGHADSWFEDTAALRAAIARARTDKGRETAVWTHLETRRDWWARHFTVSAAVLRSAPEPAPWLSFVAVAQALLDGPIAQADPDHGRHRGPEPGGIRSPGQRRPAARGGRGNWSAAGAGRDRRGPSPRLPHGARDRAARAFARSLAGSPARRDRVSGRRRARPRSGVRPAERRPRRGRGRRPRDCGTLARAARRGRAAGLGGGVRRPRRGDPALLAGEIAQRR